jgi:hypothetical protein
MRIWVTVLFVVLFVIYGCSSRNGEREKNKDQAESVVSRVGAGWFENEARFKSFNANNEVAVNLFFDADPNIRLKDSKLHSIITTPQNSDYSYELDPISGRPFVSKKFCAVSDVWKKSQKRLNRRPYSEGIVPRMLDQLARPQKIIVFGDSDYFDEFRRTNFFETKVLGGYIEQECPRGHCQQASEWKSRLVLIGVSPVSKQYKNVNTLNELQKKIDWEEVRFYVENGNGVNHLAGKVFPAYRMGAVVEAKQSLEFATKNAIVFGAKELAELKRSCHQLYDFAYKTVGKKTALEIQATSPEEIKRKALLIDLHRKKYGKSPQPYHRRFSDFIKNFSEKYKTCSKYVQSSSINYNADRFWFFSYLDAFMQLHDLGYAYSCSSRSWVSNPITANKRRQISLNEEFSNCTNRDIEQSFEAAVVQLNMLNAQLTPSWRFIDYDKGSVGTHEKIYAWVRTDGKLLNCSNEADKNFPLNRPSFPEDVRWKKLTSEDFEKNKEKIIF